MSTYKLKDTVELIGIVAIVASLIFVGLQIRQDQQIAIVDTYGELSQSNIDLTLGIGEHIDVWKKGLDGDRLTEEELERFSVLAAAVVEYNQRVYIRWTRIGPFDPNIAASRFAFALYIYPGLRREFELSDQFNLSIEAAGGFNGYGAWNVAVSEYLAKFDREKPAIPANKRYVFWAY